MSAFVVDDETINRIVTWITTAEYQEYLRRKLAENGYDLSAAKGEIALARAMFDLNCSAVDQRYDEGEAKQMHPEPFRFKPTYATPIQVYKSLHCWLYQCSEGNVPNSPLFKFFSVQVNASVADTIINNLPEYETAKWG